MQYPQKISAPLIIHFANDGEIRFSEIYRVASQCRCSSFKALIFAGTLQTLSSREKRSGIYREWPKENVRPVKCRDAATLGNSPPSFLFSPTPRILRRFIRDFGSNPAGYRFARTRPIFFTIFFPPSRFSRREPVRVLSNLSRK